LSRLDNQLFIKTRRYWYSSNRDWHCI